MLATTLLAALTFAALVGVWDYRETSKKPWENRGELLATLLEITALVAVIGLILYQT